MEQHIDEEIDAALKISDAKRRKYLKKEKNKINAGWKYVRISNSTKILVPCDNEGNPTEYGQERIKLRKELFTKI